ncbi:hypothetical protein EVAR_46142_1 [Eumeta japonica]|uniref:Uncharacterized protein n=1 Tax=Eumeta variegata TaxID=151549 RepID=A0A4C1XTV6_EUMVA|nr:hypothetical protein EVAR_46142_1 [Eumeta japonica]
MNVTSRAGSFTSLLLRPSPAPPAPGRRSSLSGTISDAAQVRTDRRIAAGIRVEVRRDDAKGFVRPPVRRSCVTARLTHSRRLGMRYGKSTRGPKKALARGEQFVRRKRRNVT